nr:CRE-CLU-1 protein [Haemonchus contortus]
MTSAEVGSAVVANTKDTIEAQLPDSGNASVSGSPDCVRTNGEITESDPTAQLKAAAAQDAVLTLTIQPTVGDSFEFQINSGEMVQELHQVLLEREATCHKTCFSLQLNGVSLDNFTEIRAIPDLVDGSVLHVVDEPYTLREARVHIRHVRDLLRHADQAEAASAVDMNSLSFLTSVNLQERGDKEKPFDGLPPEYVVPGTKERSLAPMMTHLSRGKSAVRNMGISSFNPPPGHRKVKGDVLYIFVDTVEKRRLHITCCTKGFFVNSSTDEVFNAQASSQNKAVYHSLVDLLNVLSPGFKKIYPTIIKKRNERHMLDRLPTPYPVHSWLSPMQEVVEDSIRADDASQPHRVGFEDHLPGQIRDWNEELQTTHEMPRASLAERVTRDRSVFKIHGDFIGAAIKGAMAVVDGNVMAINPADEPRTHMFIWNNIFFSLGFDVKDHYKELGGDAAAFAATSADLQGVRAYAALDNCKLCTLGMAIIDYRGYRVTAQSIIPGILDKEQEQSVVYGSVDFGKTVVSSEKYHELLEASAKDLKLLPHEVVIDDQGNTAKLFTSYETKGIIGNDGRYYVLDLLRTMPPDVHFLQDAEVSEKAKSLGFPRPFPHKLATLRQEIVEIFHEARCMQFIKTAANHVRQHIAANKENQEALDVENEVTKALVEVSEGREPFTNCIVTKEALAKAAESVHSLRPDTFDIRFNPDCFSSTVKHAPGEDLEKQRRLVVEFMLTSQLPEFVASCVDATVTPIDGESLCDLMHTRGINVRYLGDVVRTVLKISPSSYMVPLAVTELVSRCAKHVLRQYMNTLPQEQLGCAIAHLLNAVFGNLSSDHATGGNAERNTKRSSKKSKKASASGEWVAVNTKEFWSALSQEAKNYYAFDLKVDCVDSVVEQYGVQKISLLRRLCSTLGIQLLNKDYQLDSSSTRSRQPFSEDDIQNLIPVTKHRQPCASDAKKLFTRGQQAMQVGHLREAYECIAESVNLMTSVYGALHSELAQALRLLARLSYILGDPTEAVAQQHRAALMSERCNGIDHAYTIIEYINLAHFAFSNLYIPAALRLLYRARYLLLIAHGENHPLMAQIDGNIGVILFAVHEFDTALRFLQSAEAVMAANGEPKRLKSALVQHITARAHASRGDFRAALAAEKETYSIYNNLFGSDHDKTKESSEYLSQLTMQAVAFQRKVMDATKGNSVGPLLPAQLPQPSLSSILDVLNILNGIIIISVGSMPSANDVATEAPEGKSTTESLGMTDEALD